MKKLSLSIFCMIVTIHCIVAQWVTSGANIYNSNTGNVGIGISATAEKLHIENGNVLISSSTYLLNTIMGTLKFSWVGTPNGYAGLSGITNSGGIDQVDLAFYTAYGTASEKMRIMSYTGFVGIGTAAPNAKLDVNGNIYCNSKIFIGTYDAGTSAKISSYALAVNGNAIFNKVKVKLYTNWPDYVFDKNYSLRPLKDVQKFIQLNKHLPDLPAINEVEKDGIDIASTQTMLLKKIEELTLYVIDQNKKINEQNKKIRYQDKKIELLFKRFVKK